MTVEPPTDPLEETARQAMSSDLPLAQRLRMVADKVRELSPAFADAVERFVGRLGDAEAGAGAPRVGDPLPAFALPDQAGRLVSLESLLHEGPVVVAFLRGHWCPYCRVTASALAELSATARQVGAQVVAITPESPKFSQALNADSDGALPILADFDNGYAMSINLAIWVDETMASLIAGSGFDVPTYQGNDAWFLPIPATFVLDRDGVIIARHVNPDYRERADVDEIISTLRGLT